MARVKLKCIMGCPGLKSSCQEKGLLSKISVNKLRQSNLCGKKFLMQGNILERMVYAIFWHYRDCKTFYITFE